MMVTHEDIISFCEATGNNTSCNLELLVLNSKTRSWFTSKLNFQISCQRHLKQRLLVAFFEIKRLLNFTFTLGPHTDDSCNFIANISKLVYLLTCFFLRELQYRAQKSPVWMLFLRDKSLFKFLICPVVKGSNNQEKCQS